AISCHKNNYTADLIDKSRIFSVSVLQQETNPKLITLFGYKSGREVNKFESVNYKTGKSGTPIVLEDVVAFFECEVISKSEMETHNLFIGKVLNAELIHADRKPLTYAYYRDVIKGVAPPNAPTYIDQAKMQERKTRVTDLKKYQCQVCDYVYDPEVGDEKNGIKPGTPFEELPEDWVCPVCGATKDLFEVID
ncbi:rubredoxin, partial [Bacteroidota bacterium]